MDIAKRFDRILRIFFLLQSKALVSLEEIKERFEISERTIYRDLKALEAAGVPVLNEAGLGYTIMEGFRIQPTRFSEEEMLSLMVAEKIMQKHETLFIKKHFDAALIKIKSSFRFHQKDALLQLEDKLHINENTKISEYLPNVLELLLNSIIKKKMGNIHYVKNNDTQPTERRIEPVGVFFEGGNWYAMAWCHLRKAYRNFRLDRIKKIVLLNETFTLKHLPIQELRKQSNTAPKQHITIKVVKEHAHNLHWERDIFGFYKEETEGNKMIMHFHCCVATSYFVRWFLMFVDWAEIIEPQQLQHDLLSIIHSAINKTKKEL